LSSSNDHHGDGNGESTGQLIAILTPLNKHANEINDIAVDLLHGDIIELESSDEFVTDMNNAIPIEFLNSLEISGLPPHVLRVKIGAPLVLLRNIDAKHGLMNGTRLEVVNATRICLTVKVTSGSHVGDIVMLPRVDLVPTDTDLHFEFKRRQFPVKLAYGMTINKAQGQSLNNVGVYLPSPCFGHGQLYVALSRAIHPSCVKMLI
jgi:ATP-dependent DNA helicase PIF1